MAAFDLPAYLIAEVHLEPAGLTAYGSHISLHNCHGIAMKRQRKEQADHVKIDFIITLK